MKAKIGFGLFVAFAATVMIFQNCAQQFTKVDANANPNISPFATSKVQIAPSTKAQVVINGVTVDGIAAGTYVYMFMDDNCVMARKSEILGSNPLYWADTYLKTSYDFSKSVQNWSETLVSVQSLNPISTDSYMAAMAADACVDSAITSPTAISVTTAGASPSPGSMTDYWTSMGLSNSIETQLSALHKNTKVNVGMLLPGFNPSTTPAMSLSSGATGLTFSDTTGTGTYLASLVALPASANGVQGVASNVAQLIPVVGGGLGNRSFLEVYSQIKDLVNRGAEVIYVPQEAVSPGSYCSPVIGETLYYAIARGVTVVVQAGTATHFDSKGNPLPGSVTGILDYSLNTPSDTNMPACWARYFRGVISVGSKLTASDALSSNTNYGENGVEILAPSTNIFGMNSANAISSYDNPASPTALTVGAVAHIISFYKSKGWFVSPWTIEDVLMSGSRVASGLPATGLTSRNKKVLDFTALTNFLTTLNSKTEAQARVLASDNPDAGQGIGLSSIGSATPIKLDVYTKSTGAYVKDRLQFQAALYYSNGSVKVISDSANWSTSDSSNFPIDANGVVYPGAAGTFTITAKDPVSGLTSSYTATATANNAITGQSAASHIVEVQITPADVFGYDKSAGFQASFNKTGFNTYQLATHILGIGKVYAVYDSGLTRDITGYSSYSILYKNAPISKNASGFNSNVAGSLPLNGNIDLHGIGTGDSNTIMIFYAGQSFPLTLNVPAVSFKEWRWPNTSNYVQSTTGISARSIYEAGVSANDEQLFAYCIYPNGAELPCPGYNTLTGNSFDLTDNGTPTLYGPYSGCYPGFCNWANVPTNTYQFTQQFPLWVNGVLTTYTNSHSITTVPVTTTPVLKVATIDLRTGAPAWGSTVFPSQIGATYQLAPTCLQVNYIVNQENSGLGISVQGQVTAWSSANGSLSVTNGGVAYQALEVPAITQSPMIFRAPASQLGMQLKVNEASNTLSATSPFQIVQDPFDSHFANFVSEDANGYVTPTSLPALPTQPATRNECQSAANSTGFHAGNGTAASPYLICNFAEFATAAASTTSSNLYYVLGANIDLSGQAKLNINFVTPVNIDGAFYRMTGANISDSEADIFIFNQFTGSVSNLVIQNNNFTGNNVSFISQTGNTKTSGIYMYNNTIVANNFSGTNASRCERCFSNNNVQVRSMFTGITQYGLAAASFASDTVRYIGVAGSGRLTGVAMTAVYSGSNTTFTQGSGIGGVSTHACHHCYSAVSITTSNFSVIGGIAMQITSSAGVGGNLVLGDSSAQIIASGAGAVGGLVGMIGNDGGPVTGWTAHTHIMNSSFTGSINNSLGQSGGLVGTDTNFEPTYFSNVKMTGTLTGANNIGSLIGATKSQCLSEQRSIYLRNGTITGGAPAVGNYFGSALNAATAF